MTTTSTTSVSADTTLGEIVNNAPGTARVLERFGLDYCCGGSRTLSDACDATGLALAEVIAEIDGAPRPTGATADAWPTMSPGELVDHLEATHHAYLHAELSRLDSLFAKVIDAHGARHPELATAYDVFADLRAELEPHLQKEERVLFPMIRTLATASEPPTFHCGTLRNPISMMLLEHDRAGELLAALRSPTDGYRPPDDACASYRALFQGLAELEADTHLHVHKENNVLFPAVVALEAPLSGSDEEREVRS